MTAQAAADFMAPFYKGQAAELRTLARKVKDGTATPVERERVHNAVLVLLADREKWEGMVTESTQARMRFLFINQEDLPMEALDWIVKTNRGEPTE